MSVPLRKKGRRSGGLPRHRSQAKSQKSRTESASCPLRSRFLSVASSPGSQSHLQPPTPSTPARLGFRFHGDDFLKRQSGSRAGSPNLIRRPAVGVYPGDRWPLPRLPPLVDGLCGRGGWWIGGCRGPWATVSGQIDDSTSSLPTNDRSASDRPIGALGRRHSVDEGCRVGRRLVVDASGCETGGQPQ